MVHVWLVRGDLAMVVHGWHGEMDECGWMDMYGWMDERVDGMESGEWMAWRDGGECGWMDERWRRE